MPTIRQVLFLENTRQAVLALFCCAALFGSTLWGQTRTTTNLATQSHNPDFSAFPMTKPMTVGTALPGSCTSGQTFLMTGTVLHFYGCNSANAWYQMSTAEAAAAVASLMTVGSTLPGSCTSGQLFLLTGTVLHLYGCTAASAWYEMSTAEASAAAAAAVATEAASLAGPSGASQIGYRVTGYPTGSVARTEAAKEGDWLSVLDFGADPTGTTDSSTAIGNAITAASIEGGQTVYFPRGTYAVCNLSLPQGVSLLGSSGGGRFATNPIAGEVYASTLISNCASPMITPALHWSNLIQNFTLNANYQASIILALTNNPEGATFSDLTLIDTAAGGAGIDMVYDTSDPASAPPSGNLFENVKTLNMQGVGLLISGGTINTFVGCNLTSSTFNAVVINGQSDDNMFYGGFIAAPSGYSDVVLNYAGDSAGGYLNNFYGTALATPSGATAITANNNAGLSFVFGSYASCCGTLYATTSGGLVKFADSQLPGASGYPNSFAITPTGSPYAWTNTKPYAVEVIVAGGTVSGLQVNRNGTGSASFAGPNLSVTLQPTDILVVAYSAAPTMLGIPQ
jgi:hypothetical protein